MEELSIYSKLSYFKVNYEKCEILPIATSNTATNLIKTTFPFKITTSHIKYLGTKITLKVQDLFDSNNTPLLHTLTRDLKKWNKPHFSWIGRINIIKINIPPTPPRLLYLFQTVPVRVPQSYFKTLQKTLMNIVWSGNRSRIAFTTLTRPKTNGGLGVSEPYKYYLATQFTIIIDWSNPNPGTGMGTASTGDITMADTTPHIPISDRHMLEM
ncbi:Hypothetical predicted protein [Pelobates cultripes]|uniref:Uncharacterized protein n=1 Tax=Pelobates cultripes TaxID=61616 RepID=A0AAD1SJ75_PELCU|nr:Hypothetical predicted protein [Pelobates cultripes]